MLCLQSATYVNSSGVFSAPLGWLLTVFREFQLDTNCSTEWSIDSWNTEPRLSNRTEDS